MQKSSIVEYGPYISVVIALTIVFFRPVMNSLQFFMWNIALVIALAYAVTKELASHVYNTIFHKVS